ncbi:hypothetical protein D3C76_1529960 [compost metagenome]
MHHAVLACRQRSSDLLLIARQRIAEHIIDIYKYPADVMLSAHPLDLLLSNLTHRTDNRQQLTRRRQTARQGIAQPGGAHQQRAFIAGKGRTDNLIQLVVALRIDNHQLRITM